VAGGDVLYDLAYAPALALTRRPPLVVSQSADERDDIIVGGRETTSELNGPITRSCRRSCRR
jgi:hypothetical protein